LTIHPFTTINNPVNGRDKYNIANKGPKHNIINDQAVILNSFLFIIIVLINNQRERHEKKISRIIDISSEKGDT